MWVQKVLRAIDPKRDDVFVEIGPGLGALTRPLAERARHVIAFEIDRDLAATLRENAPARFTLVEGDFLEMKPARVHSAIEAAAPDVFAEQAPGRLRVAGNLPYNVASPILFELCELCAAGIPVADATVMLQREVADRLVASPGTKEYGVLSILMQHQAEVERVLSLPPGAFRPPPKVQSSMVRLRFHRPTPEPVSQGMFVALVQAIFTRRRKTLANALRAFEPAALVAPEEALETSRVDGSRRPETLTVRELVTLSDAFSRAVL